MLPCDAGYYSEPGATTCTVGNPRAHEITRVVCACVGVCVCVWMCVCVDVCACVGVCVDVCGLARSHALSSAHSKPSTYALLAPCGVVLSAPFLSSAPLVMPAHPSMETRVLLARYAEAQTDVQSSTCSCAFVCWCVSAYPAPHSVRTRMNVFTHSQLCNLCRLFVFCTLIILLLAPTERVDCW